MISSLDYNLKNSIYHFEDLQFDFSVAYLLQQICGSSICKS